MSNTFNDITTLLTSALTNNAALSAFCTSKWNKALTIKNVFKQRNKIQSGNLPIIMITRPSLIKSFRTGARDGTHTVLLYAGFHQLNKYKAQAEMIEFEEKIDDALLTSTALIDATLELLPTESVNDEGKYHPFYFIVMEVHIQHRRQG